MSMDPESNIPQLSVVMPAYNEEASIRLVIKDWVEELDRLKIDYEILAYDDGSGDATGRLLKSFSNQNPRIQARSHANLGHGPTIMRDTESPVASGSFKWTPTARCLPMALRRFGKSGTITIFCSGTDRAASWIGPDLLSRRFRVGPYGDCSERQSATSTLLTASCGAPICRRCWSCCLPTRSPPISSSAEWPSEGDSGLQNSRYPTTADRRVKGRSAAGSSGFRRFALLAKLSLSPSGQAGRNESESSETIRCKLHGLMLLVR